MNNSITARYTVIRGAKSVHEMGKVTLINGEPELPYFKDEKAHCNKINGTERTIFPGRQTDQELVWFHVVEACRSVVARPQKRGHKRISGIKTTYKDVNFQDDEVSKAF